MKRKSTILFVLLALTLCLPFNTNAKRVRYISTDYRFNYVKLVELKPKEAEKLNATQPYTIDEKALAEGLRSLVVNRRHMVKDGVTELEIFNDSAVSFLSRNFTVALSEASKSEEIWFSYLVKTPIVIIRNDRLTAGSAWMESDGLHMQFGLLKSPIFGDTNKRGYESKVIKKKQGARLTLGYAECQKPGNEADEIVLDINCFAEKIKSAPQVETVTTKSKKQAKETEVSQVPEKSTEDRLKEIDDLKEKKLITNKEYKKLRKEILKDIK